MYQVTREREAMKEKNNFDSRIKWTSQSCNEIYFVALAEIWAYSKCMPKKIPIFMMHKFKFSSA